MLRAKLTSRTALRPDDTIAVRPLTVHPAALLNETLTSCYAPLLGNSSVCCADEPGGECANGFPETCSRECASVFSIFSDDCEGMLDFLGLATPEYVEFTARCQESFVPAGIAECDTDGCEGTLAMVQFGMTSF